MTEAVKRAARAARTDDGQRWIDLVIRVGVVLSLLAATGAYFTQRQLATCLATYDNKLNSTLVARTNANNRIVVARDTLLLDLLDPPHSEELQQAQMEMIRGLALGDQALVQHGAQVYLRDAQTVQNSPKLAADLAGYNKAAAENLAFLRSHPLPEPPKATC